MKVFGKHLLNFFFLRKILDFAKNSLGEIVSSKDQLGNTTTYNTVYDGQGGSTRTTTFADGGTRIETANAQGDTTITGTAQPEQTPQPPVEGVEFDTQLGYNVQFQQSSL